MIVICVISFSGISVYTKQLSCHIVGEYIQKNNEYFPE